MQAKRIRFRDIWMVTWKEKEKETFLSVIGDEIEDSFCEKGIQVFCECRNSRGWYLIFSDTLLGLLINNMHTVKSKKNLISDDRFCLRKEIDISEKVYLSLEKEELRSFGMNLIEGCLRLKSFNKRSKH